MREASGKDASRERRNQPASCITFRIKIRVVGGHVFGSQQPEALVDVHVDDEVTLVSAHTDRFNRAGQPLSLLVEVTLL